MKVRKKAVEVEAIQYLGEENFNLVRLFVGSKSPIHQMGDQCIGITTLEGVMKASPGDWIIRGVRGEFHPCKPDIFAATYETRERRCGECREQSHMVCGAPIPSVASAFNRLVTDDTIALKCDCFKWV